MPAGRKRTTPMQIMPPSHGCVSTRHQVFDELLDHTKDADDNKRAVYADSAYRFKATEDKLTQTGITSQICEKGTRAATLTKEQKEANWEKSKVRARVEHIFGAQEAMGGHWLRTSEMQGGGIGAPAVDKMLRNATEITQIPG